MKRNAAPALRIKDLPPDQSLRGVRFRFPGDGRLYYWHSQWSAGVWAKRDPASSQVFPLFCAPLTAALEWLVVPEKT